MIRILRTLPIPVAASGAALAMLAFAIAGNSQDEAKQKRSEPARKLTLNWEKNYLTISGDHLPGKSIRIHYLEAYCRPGSTDRDWHETVIGHTTELIKTSPDQQFLHLRCTVKDGVVVDHEIRVEEDAVTFAIKAHNPTDQASLAHWVQPCIRVDRFVGTTDHEDKYAYIKNCFVYLDGKRTMMPTPNWATEARYIPGQVWCPKHVPREDVNPRPLSDLVPSNGLIGCFSEDRKWILATAFEPYQELFQGVIQCIHSDFRIGGLEPGETKSIRGAIYIVPADEKALLEQYARDFPEHQAQE